MMTDRLTGRVNSMANDSPLRLKMSGVRKAFGATVALDGVDLEVRPGEVHALIGENGAGKSTIMKVLSGAELPDDGTMWLDGKSYQPDGPAAGRQAGVAMIYQELSLAPHLSVMENILLGVEPTKPIFGRLGCLDLASMQQQAADALAQVGRTNLDPQQVVGTLSLADQQLVEVARSVAVGCRILVLDEPTSSVTAEDVETLFQLIGRLKAQGISIVYVSHFLEEIERISDRFTVLRDGKAVGTMATGEASRDEIVKLMVGRNVSDLYPRSARNAGDVLLDVTKLQGQRYPVGASLELHRGEVLGIAGLVGSGRTELMRAVFGLDEVVSGAVRVGQLSSGNTRQLWKAGVGLVSEDRKSEGLALGLSIADNLTLPRLSGLGPWGLVMPSQQTKACTPWARELAIKLRHPSQLVSDLSGGNQQKVALARLLHADVDVLLLDEPTRGIDVGSKSQIYRLIDQLIRVEQPAGRQAKGALVVSSYLPELMGICDRIAVMRRGVLGPAIPVSERNEHEIMLEAIEER